MISVSLKIQGGGQVTLYNEGPHTAAGVVTDALTEQFKDINGKIEEIVINPDDKDFPGAKT